MPEMPPLIVTACDPLVNPLLSTGEPQPTEETVTATVDAIVEAVEAGAAISHHHGVYSYTPEQGYKIDEEATTQSILGVRERCDAIVQMGGPVGAQLYSEEGQRNLDRLWKTAKLDQISLVTNQMEFVNLGLHRRTDRKELAFAAGFCFEQGVQPEFEVWQVGDTYNVRTVLEELGVQGPFWVELLHGGNGAGWSPVTVEQTYSRVPYLPEGALWHANAYTSPKGRITPEEHTRFLTQIIARGGNVRIGKEDRPELTSGQEAKSNAELVEHIVGIARALGREVATPDQAREMLGLT
jgi:3-keto-5-aminohexanoate cleavage enzyme